MVLRHLHHSIHPDVIKCELEGLGHIARNVFNIRHHLTKAPLPLYFVDLELCDNNKNSFDLHFLCNMKITVEAPRKKTLSYSALGANLTGILKPIAPDRLC